MTGSLSSTSGCSLGRTGVAREVCSCGACGAQAEIERLRHALVVVVANTQPGMTAYEAAKAALDG